MIELSSLLWRSLTAAFAVALCLPALAEPPATEVPATSEAVTVPQDEQQDEAAVGQFLRVLRNDDGEPTALETAIVSYVLESGEGELVVDLVAVVHVGERSYYRDLDKHFEQYDVLLYELVAPEGARIERGARDNPLSGMLKNVLRLESQIERIDYTKKNFVHADLSPEQMREKMRERGEDGWTLALNIMADLMRQANAQERRRQDDAGRRTPDINLGTLLFDPKGPLKMKRMMAEQFEDLDDVGGLGQTLNRLLIVDRNKAALDVLRTEIDNGRKRIGIFYGAAHMPDFEKRLTSEFGLKRADEQWLKAWDLE